MGVISQRMDGGQRITCGSLSFHCGLQGSSAGLLVLAGSSHVPKD